MTTIAESWRPNSVAALLHAPAWRLDDAEVVLGPGLTLHRLADSPMETLYHSMCTLHGVDNGDPYAYRLQRSAIHGWMIAICSTRLRVCG